MTINKISQHELLDLLESRDFSFALIDVREKTEYEIKQILFATNIPRRLLESRIADLVPIKNTKIILYDDDGGKKVNLAENTLKSLGYENIFVLEGGLNKWDKKEYLFSGTHVPSKAFGEQVFITENIPTVEPHELKNWMEEENSNFIIFDVRPNNEVKATGSIPGAVNIPGVELPLEIYKYVNDGKTKLIITCAGRTRGLIATQTLRKMGIENVYNLKDGTMGWVLANFELDDNILHMEEPSTGREKSSQLNAFVKQIQESNIQLISFEEYQQFQDESYHHTTYFFDVRTPSEYSAGHIPGTLSLPGGQAIQTTDEHVAVRDGKIIFISNHRHRAVVTAFWFKNMGFQNVYVIDGGVHLWEKSGLPIEKGERYLIPLGYKEAYKKVNHITSQKLKKNLGNDTNLIILDVDTSGSFKNGHIPNSTWLSRGALEFYIHDLAKKSDTIILTCQDGLISTLCAVTLEKLDFKDVYVLRNGKNAWSEAGFSFEYGSEGIIHETNDIFIESEFRDKKGMIDYLEWEVDLESRMKLINS
jgi:rhodanese-related sulfurtransferase